MSSRESWRTRCHAKNCVRMGEGRSKSRWREEGLVEDVEDEDEDEEAVEEGERLLFAEEEEEGKETRGRRWDIICLETSDCTLRSNASPPKRPNPLLTSSPRRPLTPRAPAVPAATPPLSTPSPIVPAAGPRTGDRVHLRFLCSLTTREPCGPKPSTMESEGSR